MRFSPVFSTAILSCAVGVVMLGCSDTPGKGDSSNLEETSDIFSKSEAMPVTISAPLSKLFARYAAGEADPPEADAAPGEPKFSEPGQLVFTDGDAKKTLDMRVYVRGESSKSDCPFPKLKLDFTD